MKHRNPIYIAGMLWLILCTASLRAQSRPPDPYVPHVLQGYAFISPGAYIGYSENVSTIHIGLGVEAFLVRGLAAGGEAGVLGAIRGSDPLGLFSLDGSYHFFAAAEDCAIPLRRLLGHMGGWKAKSYQSWGRDQLVVPGGTRAPLGVQGPRLRRWQQPTPARFSVRLFVPLSSCE